MESWFSSRLDQLSRREFLKLSSLGLLGLMAPPIDRPTRDMPEIQKGRVLDALIYVYNQPSFNGEHTKFYWRDLIVSISEITVGKESGDYNRVWYKVGDEGYVHSGGVQPVEIKLNQPETNIPAEGHLAVVTVPFTDTFWDLAKPNNVAYRLYYDTTHWVTGIEYDETGKPWYAVFDDKWKAVYYANAKHLRMVTLDETLPISPGVFPPDKRIEIHLNKQLVVAYEGDKPVYVSLASTGARFSSGNYSTPIGLYITNWKRSFRHMAAGDHAAPNSYDLPGVPWVCYFTENGISLHGTYWHNDFGRPRSHGCVNLPPQAANWFYRWTLPTVPLETIWVYEKYGTNIYITEE